LFQSVEATEIDEVQGEHYREKSADHGQAAHGISVRSFERPALATPAPAGKAAVAGLLQAAFKIRTLTVHQGFQPDR
jgi:hypothetical protein